MMGCAVLRANVRLLDGDLGRLQAMREPGARGGWYYGPPVAHVERGPPLARRVSLRSPHAHCGSHTFANFGFIGTASMPTPSCPSGRTITLTLRRSSYGLLSTQYCTACSAAASGPAAPPPAGTEEARTASGRSPSPRSPSPSAPPGAPRRTPARAPAPSAAWRGPRGRFAAGCVRVARHAAAGPARPGGPRAAPGGPRARRGGPPGCPGRRLRGGPAWTASLGTPGRRTRPAAPVGCSLVLQDNSCPGEARGAKGAVSLGGDDGRRLGVLSLRTAQGARPQAPQPPPDAPCALPASLASACLFGASLGETAPPSISGEPTFRCASGSRAVRGRGGGASGGVLDPYGRTPPPRFVPDPPTPALRPAG